MVIKYCRSVHSSNLIYGNQGDHPLGKLENLEKSGNLTFVRDKSGKLYRAFGVVPQLRWSQNKHKPSTVLRNRLPVGGRCVYVLQLFFLFSVFSVHQNYETTVLGNG